MHSSMKGAQYRISVCWFVYTQKSYAQVRSLNFTTYNFRQPIDELIIEIKLNLYGKQKYECLDVLVVKIISMSITL